MRTETTNYMPPETAKKRFNWVRLVVFLVVAAVAIGLTVNSFANSMNNADEEVNCQVSGTNC